MGNYINQRLQAAGANNNSTQDIEALRAENEQLKKQLERIPVANFKSEMQIAFEQSPEFENILNALYLRFMRDKFGIEFRNSPYYQDFQILANKALGQFEKNYKHKEASPNGSHSKKNSATNEANAGKDVG